MSSFFTLKKKKIRKSIAVDFIQLQYHNFSIEIEIDLENMKSVIFRFENTKMKDIGITKHFHEDAVIAINYYVDSKIDRITEFQEELQDATDIMRHASELDMLVAQEIVELRKEGY